MKYSINYKFIYLIILTSITACFISCGEEEPIDTITLDSALIGNWDGLVFQEGVGTYEIKVAIRQPSEDGVVGTGNYDEECTFNWVYVREEGESFVFNEVILTGLNYCIDGTMRVTVVDDIELALDWTGSDSADNKAEGRIFRF